MARPVHPSEQLKELGPANSHNDDLSEVPNVSGLSRRITGPFQVLGAFFVFFNVWLVIPLTFSIHRSLTIFCDKGFKFCLRIFPELLYFDLHSLIHCICHILGWDHSIMASNCLWSVVWSTFRLRLLSCNGHSGKFLFGVWVHDAQSFA
jgi:hypothetical protein